MALEGETIQEAVPVCGIIVVLCVQTTPEQL